MTTVIEQEIDFVDEETEESRSHTKVPRSEQIAALRERDGDTCQFPTCGLELDFDIVDGPLLVTIDHWMPQHYGKSNGWTYDEIWDLTNLKLMHKRCNAKKGERIPDADGTIPERATRTFKYRRDKRAQRAEICTECNAGRNLGPDEWCNACGSGPQPARFPKWRQMSPKDCDHDAFYCVSCTIWFPETRRSALDTLITGGDAYQ